MSVPPNLRVRPAGFASLRWFGVMVLSCGIASTAAAQNSAIYADSLQNGWADWSGGWGSTVNWSSTAYVHSGTYSVAVTFPGAWEALDIGRNTGIDVTPYSSVTFWINGGSSGGQALQVTGHAGGAQQLSTNLPTLAANTWLQYTIALSTLGVANRTDFDGLYIWDRSGSSKPTFYVDDIFLVTNSTPPPSVTLTSPANNSSFASPATINLAATVVTNNHFINKVQFWSNGTNLLNEATTPPYAYTWNNVGAGTYALTAKVIYDTNSSITSVAANVTVTGAISVTVNVNAATSQHAISPLIYGVAFAGSSSQISDLNTPIHRSGGNAETRYNWTIDAHNRGGDWYFESLADSAGTTNASDDSFISMSKAGGAEPMLTLPMIGWPCKLGPSRGRLSSFSIAKYGPQTGSDSAYFPDAGNGISTASGNPYIINDPTDANFQTNSSFWFGWVQWLTNNWGMSTNGGLKYYLMDNEHSIWFSTHRDVHPVGPTMQEIRNDIIDYGGMVKSNDPNAMVCAPEEWGWGGYINSGYDQQHGGSTDRNANGGWDYCPWLLNQLHLYNQTNGQRVLDYFTLHCYPQEGNVGSGSDVSTTTSNLRNQTTRVFWDPNYVDPSWINQVIQLIPRMKGWVNQYYPGTKIGVTEYNWGADGYINGATAQADILGIFGRDGLDLATRWTTPDPSTPTYKAFKMYRNYDGNKSTFGDTSVSDSVSVNVDNLSSFAALRSSDGALTVMVVNKQLSFGALVTLNLSNFAPGTTAQAWQLTSGNSITRLSDISLSGSTLSASVPAQSITLFVIPGAAAVTPPPPPTLSGALMSPPGSFNFALNGQSGMTYIISYTTDLTIPVPNWTPMSTNTLSSSSSNLVFTASDSVRFYRAQWAGY